MVFDLLLLLCGLALLDLGANQLISSSLLLSKRFHLPTIIAGFVIVGFGTSLPEFFINVSASVHEQSDIVFGNVIGSDIFNLLAILGVVTFVYPIKLSKPNIRYEFPLLIISVLLIWPMALFFHNNFGIVVGIVYLIGFIGFLCYLFIFYHNKMENLTQDQGTDTGIAVSSTTTSKLFLNLLWAFILLFGGGELVVMYTINLGHLLGIPQHILALTVVAIGSSLPELMASIAAARKHYTDLIIGNILGSNIFNILFILGVSYLIHPVHFDAHKYIMALILIIAFSLYYMIVGVTYKKHVITKITAILPLIVYVLYVLYLIIFT